MECYGEHKFLCLVSQLCLTLCYPMDCSPTGSSVHGIFWARILEWVAISFSNWSSRPRDPISISCVSCMAGGFFSSEPSASLKEYWSGLPCPPPGHFPNPGIEPRSIVWTTGKPKNTGVGSLSILQGTFPTHKLNRGLLHCKQILYQLSYQGNPNIPWINGKWIILY